MPSTLSTDPLLDPDASVPLNVAAMIQLLETRNDEFSLRLTDVLRQLGIAIQTIWKVLKTQPPEVDDITILSPEGTPSAYLGPESVLLQSESDPTLQLSATPISVAMGNSDENISMLAGGDQAYTGWTRNGAIEVYIQCDGSGTILNLASGAEIRINGLRILTDRQASVASVSGTAGASYTATEQALINDLKTAVNDLISRLQNHGIIA